MSKDGEPAPPKHLPPALVENIWKAGQSGNPKGRPKGSRNKLSEQFLSDFYEAWLAFGRPALLAAAWTKPAEFVKVAASLLPKEMHIKDSTFDDMSDDELFEVLETVRTIRASGVRKKTGNGSKAPAGNTQPGGIH